MIAHQIKFAARNLVRSKTFTAINISGLVISLTAVILMSLYIENELSFDAFHKNGDHIYRVVDDKQANALFQHGAGSAGPMAPALLHDFAQIKRAVRLISGESLIKYQNRLFEERHLYYADPGMFSLFDFPVLSGNAATALSEPMTLVMTKTTATKYFGHDDAVGKTVIMNGASFKVTAVIADIPGNSHLQFDVLVSMATAEKKESGYEWLFDNWYSNNFYTYILLPGDNDASRLVAQFDDFANRHGANTSSTTHRYNLEKLTDIYLHSDRDNQAGKTGSIRNLYIFGAIALVVLLLAAINFINLSTARASERAKEVAIKKINGVTRSALITQFFIESFVIVGIAMAIAILSVLTLLPAFNAFSGKDIVFDLLKPMHIATLVLIVLAVGFLAGGYPAFVLSGFKPVTALKGAVQSSGLNIGIRKGLIIFQFSVSIILIISSIVVYMQLRFMQRYDLGFKPSQTVVLNFEGDNTVQKSYSFIRDELMHINGIKSVSASSAVPGSLTSSGWSMEFAKQTGDTVHAELPIYLTDFHFMDQFQIPMVAGRALSSQFAADTVESMIINQTALQKLGFSNADEAIGVRVRMFPNDARVIGVFRDFHFESLQNRIEPLAIRIMPDKFRVFCVEISTENIPGTIQAIEKLWKDLVPQRPLEYSFLSDTLDQQYQAEIKFGQLFGVFTGLAICIACFGLFGLALFSIKQRQKEIGIRKVIGASVMRITALLSGQFLLLVLIAIIIACPVALLIMSKWIREFPYRINLSWWIFVTGSVVAIVVALGTISYQALRAAMANPINSLRNE